MSRDYTVALTLFMIPVLSAGCGGDEHAAEAEPAAAASIEAQTGVEGADAAGAADPTVGLLDPNLATEDEMATVPGITPEVAAAVIDGRPYQRTSDLHAALSGAIGEEAALAAYSGLWLPIDLNRATREEIMLIPGMSERMAHEFEEYRPYVDLDQFRREIGKYVDEDEVARFERYVTLN